MRIGFITTELPPAFGSGLATYTGVAARAWAEAGHEVHVLAPAPHDEERDGVRVHAFRLPELTDQSLREGLRGHGDEYEQALRFQTRLDTFVRETGVDVLEAQDASGLAYFFLQQRAWRSDAAKLPVVHRLQAPSIPRLAGDGLPRHGLSRYVMGLLEDGVARMADAWLAPSARLVRLTKQRLRSGSPQVTVAPFPIEPFTPSPTERAPELLFVGQLRRSNGVEELVDALRSLLPTTPGWRARLIGSDWFDPLRGSSMRDLLIASLGVSSDRVSFEAPLPPPAIRAALQRAAIVVVPSLTANMSYAAVEALASGAVVVASDASAAADLIQDGVPGLNCRAGDAADLSRAMNAAMALSPQERASMGAAAARAMLDRTAPDRFVARVSRSYARLGTRACRIALSTPPPATTPARKARRMPETCAVIIPCFNLGETVSETLESVLASTRVPDEIIVVDDGSTDAGTVRVLDSWASRVQVIRTAHQGPSESRNAGAAASTADAIAFLDADDLLSPRFFEYAMDALRRCPDVGFVTSWVQMFGAGNAVFCPPSPHFPLQLVRNLSVSFGLMRREAFDDAGGYKDLMRLGYEDWEFWIGVLEAGWGALTIPERLYHYRWRQRSLLRSMTEPLKEAQLEHMMLAHPRAYRIHHRETRLLQLQQFSSGHDAMLSLAAAVSRAGHQRVTVYGAGQWGRLLGTELMRRGIEVRRYVDSNERLHGTTIDRVPVASLAEAVASGDRTFVVGSLSFASAIANAIHAHCQVVGVSPVVFS